MANPVPKVATAQGAIPPALAPSVEKAYKLKCIDLKRRMNEVEESNNAYRLRKVRLMRGIRKMRLERAFLLETLGKRMRKNGSGINGLTGTYDEDSEGSSESPPTPQEKPLRSKRGHRRPLPSPPSLSQQLSVPSNPSQPHPCSSFTTPIAPQSSASFSTIAPTNGTPITLHQQQSLQHQHRLPSSEPSRLFAPTSLPPSRTAATVNPTTTKPVHPPAPRDDFSQALIRQEILPHRSEYQIADEDLVAYAYQRWSDLGSEEQERWIAKYEADMEQHTRDMGEWRRMQRQGGRGGGTDDAEDDVEMEVDEGAQEQGPERDEREVVGGSASGGGFTAVNS